MQPSIPYRMRTHAVAVATLSSGQGHRYRAKGHRDARRYYLTGNSVVLSTTENGNRFHFLFRIITVQYSFTYIIINAYMHTHMYTHIHTHIYINIYIYIYIYICLNIYVHIIHCTLYTCIRYSLYDLLIIDVLHLFIINKTEAYFLFI